MEIIQGKLNKEKRTKIVSGATGTISSTLTSALNGPRRRREKREGNLFNSVTADKRPNMDKERHGAQEEQNIPNKTNLNRSTRRNNTINYEC